jgi:hypothetical protein
MKQKIEIKGLIERMEKPNKNESFLMAAEVAILKNKELLIELAK